VGEGGERGGWPRGGDWCGQGIWQECRCVHQEKRWEGGMAVVAWVVLTRVEGWVHCVGWVCCSKQLGCRGGSPIRAQHVTLLLLLLLLPCCVSRWMAADLYLREVDILRFEVSENE